MTDWEQKLLSDLFDGELVDPDALEQALTQPDAAPYLVRLVRLRQLAQEDDRRPDEEFYRQMEQALHRKRAWFLRGPMLPLPLAAAAGLCGMVLVGWMATSASVMYGIPPAPPLLLATGASSQPVPDDESLRVAGASVKAPTPATPSQSRPPRPTREVKFVDGQDWHTTADRGGPDHEPR